MQFKIIVPKNIHLVVPLVKKMAKESISDELLLERFQEMVTQNYECVGVFKDEVLVGVAGMWFCTRHYSGRSVEIDHVFIEKSLRNQGIGSQLLSWIENYTASKGFETIELNTYIENEKSHDFYDRKNYKKLGYHFLKTL